ncbi:MAG: amidohydrolase family protein [Candidatus Helarchaeota archaeon]|nr:amidohydrolase family protein [Candidatus Helarchaeota archaeon]
MKMLNFRIALFSVTAVFIFLLGFFCAKEEDLKNIRLLDYKPKSMLQTKVTIVEKAKFPAIDAHNHLRSVVNSGADVSELVKIMDECNVKAVVNLDGGFGENLDKHLKVLKEPYPDRFIVYAWIEWNKVNEPGFSEYSAKQLEEAVKKGVQGLKIFKPLGLGIKDEDGSYLRVDTPKLDAVWEKCGELGIPVTIHVADPVAFFTPLDRFNERLEELIEHPDWMFNKPEFYSHDELIEQRNNVIRKHKNTVFVGAHVGNYPENLQKVAEYLDEYPNFNVDICARLSELGRQPYSTRKFIIKYADRVLFGTDGSDAGPINAEMYHVHWRFLETDDEYFDVEKSHHLQGRWRVYGVYLPDEVLEKIYYLNAKRLIPGIS